MMDILLIWLINSVIVFLFILIMKEIYRFKNEYEINIIILFHQEYLNLGKRQYQKIEFDISYHPSSL